jgi:hypothetical protein
VLQGIALTLQGALGNLGNPRMVVDVLPKQKHDNVQLAVPPINSTGTGYPRTNDPHSNPTPQDAQEEKQEKPAAETRLNIVRASNDDMEMALCKFDVGSDATTNFTVYVNEEHEIIQEMLLAEPLNKMALHLMVTREIAAGLIKHDAIVERCVSREIKQFLAESDEPATRERMLARLLMDASNWTPPSLEAA